MQYYKHTPSVEGVIVDYHTRKKYHPMGNISPETKVEGDIFFQRVLFFLQST